MGDSLFLKTRRGLAALALVLFILGLAALRAPLRLRADEVLSLNVSSGSVVLDPGESVTITVDYSSSVEVKNISITPDTAQSQGFVIQSFLNSSSASINGAGDLGSITVTAPSSYAQGSLVLNALAEDASDPNQKYSAQAVIPLSVNVPAPDPSAEEGGESTEAAAAAEEAVLDLKINGVGDPVRAYASAESPSALPEGYSEVVAEIQGQLVKTYKKAGRAPLLNLRLLADGAEALYSFDAAAQSIFHFYPDIYTEIGGQSVIVSALAELAPDPALVAQSYDVNGQTTLVWIGELKGKEYVVLRAQEGGKASALYSYEIGEGGGTMLVPFNYAEIINPVTPTPLPSTSADSATSASDAAAAGSASSVDWVFWILVIVIVLMLAGLFGVFWVRRRNETAARYEAIRREAPKRTPGGGRGPGARERAHGGRTQAQSGRRAGVPLKELEPNNFSQVDDYFAKYPQRGNTSASFEDPGLRSGVRQPRLPEAPNPAAPRAPQARGGLRGAEFAHKTGGQSAASGAAPRRASRFFKQPNPRHQNPYRTYYHSPEEAEPRRVRAADLNGAPGAPEAGYARRPNSTPPIPLRRLSADESASRDLHDEVRFDE